MIKMAKELAIAKVEGIIHGEVYNTTYGVFEFKINGMRKQIHLSYEEYEAYDALVEIYKCRSEKAIF